MKTKIYESLAEFFPLWRETTLGKVGHENIETKFIIDIFKKYPGKIKTVIDLGGGVGLHANLLSKAGYDVTLFDQSAKALAIAKKNNPKLKTVKGSFESIKVKETYDAAICVWSTLSYIFSETGRKQFYDWQKTHVKNLIILDEANFYRYSQNFHKVYVGENKDFRLAVTRDWKLTKKNLKKTKFVYEIYNKKSRKTRTIKDAENEQYLSIEKLQKYLGSEWDLDTYGGYDVKNSFDKKESSRIIPVFLKKV